MSGKIFLALLLVITFLFIPIVPIQTTERVPTKVTVPYTERESYVDYVPYQEWEKMSETFISTTNYNLKPGYFVYWSKYLPYDRKVTFYVSASDTVEVYVLSSLEYKNFYEGRSFSPEASRKDSKELQLVFLTRFNDTYYFIIKNPHTGFLGLFSKNVMIYSANANAIWEELVTKYREEIKYRDVVKYREETKYIDIPKTVYVSILSFPAGQLFGAIIILLMIISIVFTTTWQKKESVPKHHSESRVTQVLNFPDFPTPLTSKYEPLEFIGEGGFARVFKVKRKSDGKIVALKIPRLDEKTSSTFLREIASWYHLNHPNIVSLYSADILPVPYMEMEYVEGVEIDRRTIRDLERYPKPVSEEVALSIVKGIAEGLKHAHGKGVYHLDLKPLNVLIKSDLTPKITDWGLAKISARSSSTANIGYSPLYAAPEQIDEREFGQPDHRTDIYGLGVILYELLTGKLPYEAMTPSAVLGKIVAENIKPDPVSKHNLALAKFDGIIEKLLAKRKEDRFQSVDEVLSALDSMKSYKKELEGQKKSLEETKASLRKSRSREEMGKLQKDAVERIAKIALQAARLNDKPEVLNALEELKLFTKDNLEDLLGAVSSVELMIKEGIPIGDEFIGRLRVLLSRIEREVEVGE